MSIATAIVAAQEKVAAAYTKCAEKGATMPVTQNLANLDDCIGSIPKRNEWGNTGTVDAEGLAELGWNANDIAWLQSVCWWDAEDDNKWKVSDANKAFGPNGETPLTWSNLSIYEGNADIVFFPKLPAVETITKNSYVIDYFFPKLLAIPTDGWGYFNCGYYDKMFFEKNPQLISVGNLNELQLIVRYAQGLFGNNNAKNACADRLRFRDFFKPRIATGIAGTATITSIRTWFRNTSFKKIDFTEIDFSTVTDNFDSMSYSQIEDVKIDKWNYVGTDYNMFGALPSLFEVYVNEVSVSWKFNNCPCLSAASVARIVNAAVSDSPITITLNPIAYARANADADVQTALETHTNVSLASA